MLNKIGYINGIKFDELQAHLFSIEDRSKYYYYPKTQECGYKAGIDDDCLFVISKAHQHYDSRASRWVCDFGDFDELLTKQFGGYGSDPKKDYEEWLPKKIDAVKRAMAHYEELGGKLEIVVETGRFYVLKYAATRYLAIPKEFVDVERVNNYDDFTVGDISAMLSGGNPVDVEGGGLVLANTESALGLPTTVHMCEVRSKHAEMQKELERAEAEAKEKYELARKEMERKMQELKEKQELQLAELRQRVDKMKDSIFMLELNIFALRSLFGETFTLTQLRRGKTSNSPLVLYQKFKFLDEEFALLAVKEFGRFDGNHGTTTEIFKKQCVLDVFAPSEKCITFFRTSKDKKYFAYDSEIDGLKALEYYHENQVGMIIRNGENIWLSFIDEEVFVEDNLFESAATWAEAERKIKPDWKGEYDYKNDIIEPGKTKLRDPVVKKAIDKMMLFYIIEGLVQSTNIFTELKDVNLRVPSDKVIFSAADNQLESHKYPDFQTYFSSWRENPMDVKWGETILVVEKGAASRIVGDSRHWEEKHRSRGYQNRARDAEDIKPGLHQVSYIEVHDRWYEQMVDEPPYKTAEQNNGTPIYYQKRVDADKKDEPNVMYRPEVEFYVSVKRHPSDWERMDRWGNVPSRVNNVNLRVYNEDFCPVAFINSNYVMSWMEQKNIGDWYKGNYVYLVENIFHSLLKMLRGREERENTMIRVHIPEFEGKPDELDAVTDWKKEHNVKNFTEYQAKRFARWYMESGRCNNEK